jgi:hydroxyacylglutathione hydrolase
MLSRLHHLERHLANYSRRIHYSIPCKMKITPVPIRSDNYMYLLAEEDPTDGSKPKGFLIDPAVPDALERIRKLNSNVDIIGVLTTHHHKDHAGGNGIIVNRSVRSQFI